MESQKEYWDNLYQINDTGWDKGEITPPIKAFAGQLADKTIRILLPGAGNSHEAEYLHRSGFTNVCVVDISPTAIQNFKNRVPSFPSEHIFCNDFFTFEGSFDLIIEQTFFCAIPPTLRNDYAKKCNNLLANNGKLVGLLFNFPLTEEGPPFGGSREEYNACFSPHFNFDSMVEASNSIPSRVGRELFIEFSKK